MTRPTLHLCPPTLRTETLRSFERRLRELAAEGGACADIAQQLDLVALSVELRDVQGRSDAARLSVLGAAR